MFPPPTHVFDCVMDAVGNTPAVRLSRLFENDANVEIVAKLEYMNPSGSIKDRMVRYMLRWAAHRGQLKAGHVVESSSGNTGAALAMACAIHRLRCDISVPDGTSVEKIQRVRAYGANVHVCPAPLPTDHADSYYAKARELAQENRAYHLDQYNSELNRAAHYASTAPEIWAQMNGRIDYFICGIGSGGTISGVGRFLKERDPNIQVIGVEPVGSSYAGTVRNDSCSSSFCTVIEGIGKPKPANSFEASVVDDVIQVSDTDSLEFARRLAHEEGILAGPSSGSVAAGIAKLLQQVKDSRIVTVFPDSGANYFSKEGAINGRGS